ncbi:MAG TPA: hypothetical protein VM389_08720 [Phycisphaerae bacterium]|nr:hypothetical protein [Phycisphaerae bacterium]
MTMREGRLILAACAAWLAAWPATGRSAPPETRAAEVWFDDLAAPVELADADGLALLRYAAARVRGDKSPPAAPDRLRADRGPAMVFLSVSDGARPARVLIGAGRGLVEAVDRAVARASLFAGKVRWVKLDVVTSVLTFAPDRTDELRKIGPTRHGLAFERSDAPVLIPEVLTADPPPLAALPLGKQAAYRFTTAGFFSDGEGDYPLFRGHRRGGAPEADALLASAKLCGAYLARSVDAEGRFAYAYDAAKGRSSSDYNILRHAGTVYAMMELYELTRDEALLAAARRAQRYLLGTVRAAPDDPNAACVVEGDGFARLGGSALAILALAKEAQATGDRKHMDTVVKLGRYVLSCQGPDGEFAVQKQAYPSGRASDIQSEYYPGEAMFALVRLAALDKEGRWLDAAERAAMYLIRVRDRDRVTHDHWQLYALNELYRARPKEAYLRQAARIADAIVKAQRRQADEPDWVGSFQSPPRSTPTSTRMEGVAAAYALLRDFGSAQDAKGMLESLQRGVAYQLQLQILPESAMYMRDPAQSLGGVRGSFSTYEVRIDYVQHYLSAALALRRVLTHK